MATDAVLTAKKLKGEKAETSLDNSISLYNTKEGLDGGHIDIVILRCGMFDGEVQGYTRRMHPQESRLELQNSVIEGQTAACATSGMIFET